GGAGARGAGDRRVFALPFRDGLAGVAERVDDPLAEPRFVGQHRGRSAELADATRTVAQLATRDPERELEHRLDVERLAPILVGTRERLQAAHDPADPLDAIACLVRERDD